jgi:hypothetical protein
MDNAESGAAAKGWLPIFVLNAALSELSAIRPGQLMAVRSRWVTLGDYGWVTGDRG